MKADGLPRIPVVHKPVELRCRDLEAGRRLRLGPPGAHLYDVEGDGATELIDSQGQVPVEAHERATGILEHLGPRLCPAAALHRHAHVDVSTDEEIVDL
jgi:hypothetical protein